MNLFKIDSSEWPIPRLFEGTYGDYVLGKVGKVFPKLKREVI